jgi:hypothetical protein
MADAPSFAIPVRPTRHYPFSGGVEYEGEVTFLLAPDDEYSDDELATLLADVLADGPYRYGDFLNLPMPLYLLKDTDTGDVFRASVRDGEIRLHVLPDTDSAGLRALHERLVDRSGVDWAVERRVEP